MFVSGGGSRLPLVWEIITACPNSQYTKVDITEHLPRVIFIIPGKVYHSFRYTDRQL